MKKILLTLMVATSALVATVLPAQASSSACPLIVDPSGDATSGSVRSGNRADLDILSADVTVVGNTFTSVIRVARLPESGPSVDTGAIYDFYLTRDGTEYTLEALTDVTGVSFHVQTGTPTDPLSPYKNTIVTGSFDGQHEVRVTGPLSAVSLDATNGKGPVMSRLMARTFEAAGSQTAVFVGRSVDDTSDAASYRIGQKACFVARRT